MISKQKNYYTTREAARLLGVAVSTVQVWTNAGSLKAWKTAGGHRRILCDSVDKMLIQQNKANLESKITQSMSVVVVDDNEQQLRLYEKQIHALEMNVNLQIAKDGYQGMIKIGRIFPDIIITDLVMPDMDGFQLIKVLSELPELEKSLIIAVSGLTKKEIKINGGLPKRVHQLTKPIPFDEIEFLLKQKLESKVA